MDRHSVLTRRDVLGLGLAGGVTAGLGTLGEAAMRPPSATQPVSSGAPRNIIFMVADGMSTGVPSLAEPFARRVRQRGTVWYELLGRREVVSGLFETHSLTSLVTDSAAAATAWASGARVVNGALNVLPDGERLTPIGWLVRDTGRSCGLVTTTTITHATPAAFAAVQARRDDQHLIAPQYLDRVDVLLGGGREHFDPQRRADGADVFAEFAARGYAVWNQRREVLSGARPPKVLGVFGEGHLPFTLDQNGDAALAARVPTLAEMTRAALGILAESRNGFLLQVEGGRVDHAAHNNDAAALLWDQLAFDDAIAVVLEFLQRRPETLVVITSDHGTSNPGLNGMGDNYRDSTRCFERVALAGRSFDAFAQQVQQAAKEDAQFADNLPGMLRAAFGFDMKSREVDGLRDAIAGEVKSELNGQHANLVGALGQVLGNHTGIGWTGTAHTADLVLVTALGRGADAFRGLMRNTDAYFRMTDLLGIRHANPQAARPCEAPLGRTNEAPHSSLPAHVYV